MMLLEENATAAENTRVATIYVPVNLASFINSYHLTKEQEFERNAMMLYPLIQDFSISHGKAAELLGLHKWDLIEFYANKGLPYLAQTPEELDEELSELAGFVPAHPAQTSATQTVAKTTAARRAASC